MFDSLHFIFKFTGQSQLYKFYSFILLLPIMLINAIFICGLNDFMFFWFKFWSCKVHAKKTSLKISQAPN